ncbi:Protein of unknown function, DUF393 [Actinacidiphila alni]|uniref:DUF393 domain-containing protein n=1 Tax=Actinacidiphila alni TaxID=380248 RepID=A0A1I2DQ18_9ACTN|nr:DCC1-like thiol-disulfide oxidoreductase family protein [Actinacidiphila alni]SFE82373.1 Protein of unknown function, DUF393 [Actinacidiphila alni]
MTRLTQSAATARADKRLASPPRPVRLPVRRLTVLYDPACRLCAFVRDWLVRQRQLVRLDMVPVGSPEAMRRFPELDHAATSREITVVGDSGQLYRGDSAWVVCLWALADHRALSHTLTTPAGRRLARASVLTAAKYRESKQRSQTPGWFPAAAGVPVAPPRGTAAARDVPGWTYDRATGWTQSGTVAEPPGPGRPYDGNGGWQRAAEGECADGCGTGG